MSDFVIIPGESASQPCQHEKVVGYHAQSKIVQCYRCGQIFISKEYLEGEKEGDRDE